MDEQIIHFSFVEIFIQWHEIDIDDQNRNYRFIISITNDTKNNKYNENMTNGI